MGIICIYAAMCRKKRATTATATTIPQEFALHLSVSYRILYRRPRKKGYIAARIDCTIWNSLYKMNFASVPETKSSLTFTSLFFLKIAFPGSDTRAHYSNVPRFDWDIIICTSRDLLFARKASFAPRRECTGKLKVARGTNICMVIKIII